MSIYFPRRKPAIPETFRLFTATSVYLRILTPWKRELASNASPRTRVIVVFDMLRGMERERREFARKGKRGMMIDRACESRVLHEEKTCR